MALLNPSWDYNGIPVAGAYQCIRKIVHEKMPTRNIAIEVDTYQSESAKKVLHQQPLMQCDTEHVHEYIEEKDAEGNDITTKNPLWDEYFGDSVLREVDTNLDVQAYRYLKTMGKYSNCLDA